LAYFISMRLTMASRCAVLLRYVFCLLVVPALGLAAAAQQPATVTFQLDFPHSEPEHYAITVSSDGHATYDSNGKLSPQSDAGEPFHLAFTVSSATSTRIFDLAKRARYFKGKIDSGNRNLASTGVKKLIYKNGQTNTEAEYNYSPVPAVQQLTELFQGLSTTLEFGRRLDYYRHYQKLALDDELKSLEQAVHDNMVSELQAIAPILKQIVNDPAVLNVDRARAQRLLALAAVPDSGR
jgi:hypothetical protein